MQALAGHQARALSVVRAGAGVGSVARFSARCALEHGGKISRIPGLRRAWNHQRRHGSTQHSSRPRTAIFFPGQGVQKVGMLTPWLSAFPRTARPIVEEIDHVLGYNLSSVIASGPSSMLTKTPIAQPAIVATSLLIVRILEAEFGFVAHERADVALGHSLGEFAALVCAGYLSFKDGLVLVKKRAEAMAAATLKATNECGGEYGMVALVLERPEQLAGLIEAVEEFVGQRGKRDDSERADVPPIDQVLIANVNSKNQIVLSGSIERIGVLMAHVRQFLGHDPRAVRLNVADPFHSPIMRPAVGVMERLLNGGLREGDKDGHKEVICWPGKMEAISNVTARPFTSREGMKDLLARQCLETVRWWDSIRYLDQEEQVRRWIGIGPGKVGRNLVGKEVGMRGKDLVKGGGVWAITDPSEIEDVLRGLEETEGFGEDEYMESD